MATISQLEINGDTYDIADMSARNGLSNVVKTNTANTFTNDNTFNNLVSIVGPIIRRGDDGNYAIKGTNTDLTKNNNGVSSTQYPRYMIMDKNNKSVMFLDGLIGASGNTGWNLKAQNYDTSGTLVASKGISMFLNKAGNATWTVDNPENFRSAIGVSNSVITYVNLANPAVNKTFTVDGAGVGAYMIVSGGVPGSMFVSNTDDWYACVPRSDNFCYYAGKRSGNTFTLNDVRNPYASIQWVVKLN